MSDGCRVFLLLTAALENGSFHFEGRCRSARCVRAWSMDGHINFKFIHIVIASSSLDIDMK